MQSRAIMEYIFFGTSLRYLQDCEAGWTISDDEGSWYLLANLDRFLQDLDKFGLPVTAESAWELRALRTELASADGDEKLTKAQAQRLRDALKLVRHTLEAEAGLAIAFVTTEKRVEVKKLLNDVGSLMSPGVWKTLPPLARYDLEAAGRCVAFELPTAAAFHVLRATEATLRHFYRCVIRRNRLSEPSWAAMVTQMRERTTSRPDDPLLDVLDRIRVNFRNPTAHPEATYDIHEAQELFLACIEAVGRMARATHWRPVT